MLYYCISTIIQEKEECDIAWVFNQKEAVYLQIADRLRRDVLSGHYPPDGQMPTVRQLAFDAAVNPNTVQKALLLLEDEGLLYTKGTAGRFVTSDKAVLRLTAERVRRGVIRRWLTEAKELGMTTEDIIHYMEKEEGEI
jgi:DNA-binding transcriptional regulator YhcF (GntR family)